MKIIKSPKRLSKVLQKLKLGTVPEKRDSPQFRIGFVPTMGFLHEGHLSLVRRARRENDCVVVSIFVNPIQFGPNEDFKRYPRDLRRDRKLLAKEKVDFLFVPPRSSIYPKGFHSFINPGPLARYLCGPKRLGHFRGVATVVHRLFQIVRPDVAYFGAKDFQQGRIVQAMVKRLRLPVRIKICSIVRDRDGVALSSRNRYLSIQERILARSVYESLRKAVRLIRRGERRVPTIKMRMKEILSGRGVTKIDYVEIVDPITLAPVKRIGKTVLIALACFVGKTRLIDNLLIRR